MAGPGGDTRDAGQLLVELLGVARSLESRVAGIEAALEAALEAVPFPARHRIRKVRDDARRRYADSPRD